MSSDALKRTYDGNCHCGAVRFTVQAKPLEETDFIACTCSICTKQGYLFIYPEKADFAYTRGEDNLRAYHFGQKEIAHNFCQTCGTNVTATHPGHSSMAVNVRAFRDVDVWALAFKAVRYEKAEAREPKYELLD